MQIDGDERARNDGQDLQKAVAGLVRALRRTRLNYLLQRTRLTYSAQLQFNYSSMIQIGKILNIHKDTLLSFFQI